MGLIWFFIWYRDDIEWDHTGILMVNYPLVMTNIAIEDGPICTEAWWFSIVMLVYQRVFFLMGNGMMFFFGPRNLFMGHFPYVNLLEVSEL